MASAFSALRTAIEAVMAGIGAFTASQIAWDGVDFTPPDGPWVRASILTGDGRMDTAGDGVTGNAHVGVLSIAIFGKPGAGYGAVDTLADTVRDAFSRVQIGTAFFFAPSLPRRSAGDGWLQVTVTCPFEVRES